MTNQHENTIEDMGDDHIASSVETPLREDAFAISEEEKMARIQTHFADIMEILGLDMSDDSLKGTPKRVAKMFVKEIFGGLNPEREPQISTFENHYGYNQMLVEKDIVVHSTCEHHFLPIIGRAHVGYIAKGRVIGLSKINRIVDYYAKRPQVQERLTMQIVKSLKKALGTDDVACMIDAKHLCVSSRGIRDIESSTITSEFAGVFKTNENTRKEFLHHVAIKTHSNV